MEDIFNIPELDISVLTNSNKIGTEPVNTIPEAITASPIKDIPVKVSKDKVEDEMPEKPSINLIEEEIPEVVEEPIVEEQKESPIKVFANFLKEKGHIDFTDEEFRDDDDFLLEQYEKKNKDSFLNSLPEEIKELIDNYEVGVPLGKLLEKEQAVYELSSIDVEKLKSDSKLQEDIVTMHMGATGWTPEEITDKIKELEDSGLLEKESLRSLPKLVQLEKEAKQDLIVKAQKKKEADNASYRQHVEKLQSTIKDTKEFIEGVPTNEVEKKAVFEAITKYDKTGANEITKLLNDPKNYIKTAYFLKVLKGEIGKLKKIATTASVNEQKKILNTPVKTESRLGTANLEIIKSYLKTRQG